MNLNCNCIKNKYIYPMLRDYVEVRNLIPNCRIWFKVVYFYDGNWYNIQSSILSLSQHERLYYQRGSLHRQLTIFKRTDSGGDLFIFNTSVSKDWGVCFEVTGSISHSLINEVQC